MKRMKKFATSAILIGIMCGLSACGSNDQEAATVGTTGTVTEAVTTEDVTTEENTTEENTTEEVSDNTDEGNSSQTDYAFSSNDWKTLEFALDGKVYTFPMTYADVVSAGFTIDDEEMNETLESNYYTMSFIAENAEGERFYVRFKNFTDTDKEVKDCDIYGFGFEMDEYQDINPDVTLCNGVTFGMTVDEVKAIMGEPDYYYESDGDYDRKEMDYYVTGKSYDSELNLSFTDGKLDEITIENKE